MDKGHLRRSIVDSVREMVVRQKLPPGRSVGEVALSTYFGVSRTPVREALLTLEREGFVSSTRGKGFAVVPLGPEQAADFYPIIWSLEGLALEESESPTAQLIDELNDVNAKLNVAVSPYERVELDSQWHRLLVSGCSNRRLLELIDDLKQVVRRYEFAYLNEGCAKEKSTAEHARIVSLLRTHPKAASDALEMHWRDGMGKVIAMFRN